MISSNNHDLTELAPIDNVGETKYGTKVTTVGLVSS